MSRKNYISIISFLVLFAIGFVYLNKVFTSINQFENSKEDFYSLAKKTNIDVIFYGSSKSYTAINPLIVNKVSNTISFNLGSDSQLLKLTPLVLNESLKYTKPKLIVIEVYPGSMAMELKNKMVKGHQLRTFSFISNTSYNKFKNIINLYNKNEILNVYSPLFRNHTKWKTSDFINLSRRLKKEDHSYYYNGYLGFYLYSKKEIQNKYRNFRQKKIKRSPNNPKEFSIENKKHLSQFISKAKNNNIEVLVISSPDLRARYWNYNFFDEVTNYCKSQNINFLNLNNFYNEINLSINDFKDSGHLNIQGGYKTSEFLANYINNNYNLPNRSLDEIWKENNELYLNTFRNFSEKVFVKDININILENLKLENITITKLKNSYNIKVKLDKSKLNSNLLSAYNIGLHIFTDNKNLLQLSEKSKTRKLKYDIASAFLDLKDNEFSFNFTTEIKKIKKIKLFLYNKDGYKGIIGKSILLEDIYFK